jgi:site-specific recombinase XerD
MSNYRWDTTLDGVDLLTVKELLGHADITMMMR